MGRDCKPAWRRLKSPCTQSIAVGSMRRILTWAGGLTLAVAGVAFVLWSNSTPPPKTVPEAAPKQAALPPPAPPSPAPPRAAVPPSFDIVKVDPSGHAV